MASYRSSRALSSLALRTPLFTLRTELLLTLIAIAIAIVAQTARAETESKTTSSTTTITTTTTEGVSATPTPASHEEKDYIITTTFGSKATSGTAGCKTADLADDVVTQLKGKCNAWLKEQKGELKKKYQTGTCEESCNDCGMSLQRCTVTGTVHYAK